MARMEIRSMPSTIGIDAMHRMALRESASSRLRDGRFGRWNLSESAGGSTPETSNADRKFQIAIGDYLRAPDANPAIVESLNDLLQKMSASDPGLDDDGTTDLEESTSSFEMANMRLAEAQRDGARRHDAQLADLRTGRVKVDFSFGGDE